MAEFPIVPGKTAMLFFDTLNIYLHPADAERQATIDASGVIPRMMKINRACRSAGIAVFYGQADHRPDGRDFAPQVVGLGYDGARGEAPRISRRPGAAAGTSEAAIIAELAPEAGDYVIKKHRWSTFFQTHLELSLRTAGIDTVLIAGGAVEIGVASTAYAARDRDFSLIILSDVCTSGRPNVHRMFMEEVFPIFARVMTVDEAIALIGAPAETASARSS